MPSSSHSSHLLPAACLGTTHLLCSPGDSGVTWTFPCAGTLPALTPRLCSWGIHCMAPPQGLCSCPKIPAPLPAPLSVTCPKRPKGLFPAPPTDHILSAVTMSPKLLFSHQPVRRASHWSRCGCPSTKHLGGAHGQPSETLVIRSHTARPPLGPSTGDWHTVATPHPAQAHVNRLDLAGPL